MIGLAGEDAPADLAVGGEEDLRRLEMEPEVLLHCDGGFRRWSSSGELYNTEAEAGQTTQSFLRHLPVSEIILSGLLWLAGF